MVFGVPTVRRDVESYLVATLHNLIDNLSVDERQEAIIVVFIAETDLDYVTKTANELESQFGEHMDSGLLEVISPPASYYPNMSTITQTLGDPIDRVRWRSKQNLDFGYLMMYCQPKATYYVQLEDDILTKPSYLTKMKNFAVKASLEKKSWLILDF
ncbi:unnamed protein product [Medioppia subpectinata]|nr:unnamed protein product [Medioppia subpectinata]CAG2121382.1 unnamed protein product [Medioppia subpectinata]